MIKKLNLNNKEITRNILELQMVSYKIEADLIEFYEIPPLKDTIDRLEKCEEIFYGYYLDNKLVGLISYKIFNNVLDIHRVAVHPKYFRRGVANNLLKTVEILDNSINKVIVSTGKKNYPAVNFYLKNGYKKVKDFEISDDVYITQFEKNLCNRS